jgi:predicted dehydrogenase
MWGVWKGELLKQVLIRRGSPIVVDVPAPQVTDNTILVEVRCSLISTGTEVAGIAASPKSVVREALHDPKKIARGLKMIRETGLQRTITLVNSEIDSALPTGYSCSGVVIAVGKHVKEFFVGDRVACAGAGKANHAEIIAVPQNLAVRIPDGCDMESGSSATLGAIAMQGVRRADVRFGEIVAVVGLGLIGQLTVQLLKAAGCQVVGMDIDEERITLARKFGAKAAGVTELSSGMGADAVIITASSQSPSILQESIQIVRRKGRIVVVGAIPLEMDRSPLYEKEADLFISCSYGPGRYDPEYEERGLDYPYSYVRWTENRNMGEYLRLIADGSVDFRSLVEKNWPLTDAAKAYADLQENKRIAVLLSSPESTTENKLQTRVDFSLKATKTTGRIRVGLIGPGSFARAVHLPNLKRLADQYAIAGIVAGNGSTAWNAARQYGARFASTNPEDLFNDPEIDLVIIANRHHLHAAQAAAAARHGKAVLLEKPAALNASELDDLLSAVREARTPFMVGFNRRFAPLIETAKSVLDQRNHPAVITYRMNTGPLAPESWIQGPEGGGRIIGEACHIFDLFNHLLGACPLEVVAMPLHPAATHVSKTDNFSVSLRYPDGSLCTLIYTSLGSTDLPKEAMEIFFDGKTIVFDDYRRLQFYGIAQKPVSRSQQDKGHFEELRQFADYIQGKRRAPMSLEEIEAATRTSFAVHDLVQTGDVTS